MTRPNAGLSVGIVSIAMMLTDHIWKPIVLGGLSRAGVGELGLYFVNFLPQFLLVVALALMLYPSKAKSQPDGSKAPSERPDDPGI